jgi:hypothetical protein
MRRLNPTGFKIAKRGTFREINRQIAWNLVRAKQSNSTLRLTACQLVLS